MRARAVQRRIRSIGYARGSDAVNSSTFTPVYMTNDASVTENARESPAEADNVAPIAVGYRNVTIIPTGSYRVTFRFF